METLNSAVREFELGGLTAGLKYLNDRVPHRFTAVYKLRGDVFEMQAIIDKLDELVPDMLIEVPFDDSFCQYSIALNQFMTSDTAQDHRLDGHKYQSVVASYVGLPLTRDISGLYGTFCHFDLNPQTIADEEFEYLQRVTKVIPGYLEREEKADMQPL